MVNYCCVYGCGRNSKTSKHLYFHSVPKDKHRQEQWLKAAGREDLLEKPQDKRNLYRFCSRHFSAQSIKNRHLCSDAVPSLHLPGSECEDDGKEREDRCIHSDILCNNCQVNIIGFRYKCITCVDYDLCSACEMAETHVQHLMLRIPNPIKFKNVENMVQKWQQYSKDENYGNDSSDDEPIQKYAKNYDSGIDLSDDIKDKIKTEVARVMKLKPDSSKKRTTKEKTHKRVSDTEKTAKKQKTNFIEMNYNSGPEVVFADVNEIHSVGPSTQALEVKTEGAFSSNEVVEPDLPVMNIKLSDDLTELMMEVTDHKSLFKF